MGVARAVKRLIDTVLAAAVLALAAPVVLVIALAIRASMGRPVLFRQVRPGLHGRLFCIYKFRTMTDARDAQGRLLPDGERLTLLGRFLRSTSLDELPQLWNVLRGEMSLVGPRPLLPEYLDRYTPEQARRHEVRPGITGWAQVNGRNATTWEERLRQDVWYVDNWSLWLDFKILWMTVVKVLRREGVSKRAMRPCRSSWARKAKRPWAIRRARREGPRLWGRRARKSRSRCLGSGGRPGIRVLGRRQWRGPIRLVGSLTGQGFRTRTRCRSRPRHRKERPARGGVRPRGCCRSHG